MAIVVSLGGCGVPDPHKTPGLPTTPPDEQFFHDAQTHVERVLIWKCVGSERIVASNQCGMICQREWRVDRVACGATVADFDDIPVADRKPIPAGTGW